MVDMSSKTKTNFFYAGFSLASNSSHISSVVIIDNNKKILLMDRLYFTDDIKLFFNESPYIQNSLLAVGLAPDESLLDGKWRIHSKNYKPIEGLFDINRNNWTNRLNDRLTDLLLNINGRRCSVIRANVGLLRQQYGLNADYLEKTSLDCKNFQAGLKLKYGFNILPDNLLPSASLEALLLALFAYDIANNNVKTKEIGEFYGLKILNPV